MRSAELVPYVSGTGHLRYGRTLRAVFPANERSFRRMYDLVTEGPTKRLRGAHLGRRPEGGGRPRSHRRPGSGWVRTNSAPPRPNCRPRMSSARSSQGCVAACPVCSRSFRPRTLSSAWESVNHHLEDRRRQGCAPHAAVHAALHSRGGNGFGCAGCSAAFPTMSSALEHVARSRGDGHAPLHTADTRFAAPDVVAASIAASHRHSRRLTNRLNTELYSMANQGNREGVRRLLALGLDPDFSAGTDSITPLMTAAEAGHADVVEDLVATWRCDLNRRNVYGQTALAFAAQNNRMDCVLRLVDAPGVDISAQSSGYTAAQLARRAGHGRVADYLAALTRDEQLEVLCAELCGGAASGDFDSVGERIDALREVVTGVSAGVEASSRDDEPDGFNAVPLCAVCMGSNVDSVMLPCFHACCCASCATAVWRHDRVCAVCRAPIESIQKIYF
jgi:hypothetical protein